MTCHLMCKISINLNKIRSQFVIYFLMCNILINLDNIQDTICDLFHSYIPNALGILHIYTSLLAFDIVYISFEPIATLGLILKSQLS
jgi:hypothetical protein